MIQSIDNSLGGQALVTRMKEEATRIISDMGSALTNREGKIKAKKAELAREREFIASMDKNDVSENVPLHIARETVSRLVIEITALEAHTNIPNISLTRDEIARLTPGGVCTIGSIVAIHDDRMNKTWVIRLYPAGLGNAKIGAISIDTPLGQALMQHRPGETVTCNAPGGPIRYYIKEVL